MLASGLSFSFSHWFCHWNCGFLKGQTLVLVDACQQMLGKREKRKEKANKVSIFCARVYLELFLGFHFLVWSSAALSFAGPVGSCSEETKQNKQTKVEQAAISACSWSLTMLWTCKEKTWGSSVLLQPQPRNGRKLRFSRAPSHTGSQALWSNRHAQSARLRQTWMHWLNPEARLIPTSEPASLGWGLLQRKSWQK